ncbi:MAG: hypothetical protein JW876_06810 [Candidatus Krumholzibacteriota bacterium]|nr:hypothetical protein [Candidatus Krumholzibacteriota bacterium]
MIWLLAAAVLAAGPLAAASRPSVFFPGDSVWTESAAQDTLQREDRLRIDSMGELKGLIVKETAQVPAAERTWRTYKNPRVAMLCAILVPGLGQIYNEKPFKALVAGGAETFYLLQVYVNHRRAEREILERDRWIAAQDSLGGFAASRRLKSYEFWIGEYKARKTDWLWWSAGAMLVIVLDAYIDAHLHDMTFEIAPLLREEGAAVSLGMRF